MCMHIPILQGTLLSTSGYYSSDTYDYYTGKYYDDNYDYHDDGYYDDESK